MTGSVLDWVNPGGRKGSPCIHSLLSLLKHRLPSAAFYSSSCFPGGTLLSIGWDEAVDGIDCILEKMHFEREAPR